MPRAPRSGARRWSCRARVEDLEHLRCCYLQVASPIRCIRRRIEIALGTGMLHVPEVDLCDPLRGERSIPARVAGDGPARWHDRHRQTRFEVVRTPQVVEVL